MTTQRYREKCHLKILARSGVDSSAMARSTATAGSRRSMLTFELGDIAAIYPKHAERVTLHLDREDDPATTECSPSPERPTAVE